MFPGEVFRPEKDPEQDAGVRTSQEGPTMNRTARIISSLFHPATLISILALIVAGSSAAYAIVITGADIKDGSVTSADIKNGSLTGTDVKDGYLTGTDIKTGSIASTDLAPTAKGARAVAVVWGDGSGCTIVTARSRGFLGCSRDDVGSYYLTLKSGVSLANTYPICSRGSNGGFNTIYQFSCDVGPFTATKVRLRLTRVPENATTGPEQYDAPEAIPFVVVIP